MSVELRRGTQRALREANEERLLAALLDDASGAATGLTRTELAEELGLSVAAVNGLIAFLAKRNLVTETADETRVKPKSGPTPKVCRLRNDAGYVLALSLDDVQCVARLTDLAGNPVETGKSPSRRDLAEVSEPTDALQWMTEEARRLVDSLVDELVGVGISLAGPVNPGRGENDPDRAKLRVGLPAMPGWEGINVAKELKQTLGWECPFIVDNDGVLAALAEARWGAAKGRQAAVYVKWSTGIGGGLIINGDLYRAPRGINFEVGHLPVPDLGPDERRSVPRCTACGRHCLEAMAATRAILRYANRRDDRVTPVATREVIRAAHGGDAAAKAAIARASTFLGRTLAGVLTQLNPEVLVIGGDFRPEDYALIQPGILSGLREYAVFPAFADVSVEPSELAADASTAGAAALVVEQVAIGHMLGRDM